eukprot:1279282-Amorphochlora_amoeboformis.AAC.1
MAESESPYRTFPVEGMEDASRKILIAASVVYAIAGFNSAMADNMLGPSLEAFSVQIGCHAPILRGGMGHASSRLGK